MAIQANKELVLRLKKGDRKAFEDIYITFHDRLYNFTREYIDNTEDTADIIQNVFTKLWSNRDLLDDNSNIGGWLFTVTRNESLSFLEHRKIILKHRESEASRLQLANLNALKSINLSDHTMFNIYDIVEKSISKMPPQCQKVYILSKVQGMSYKLIAKKFSISEKTVEAHMSKALKILKVSLADYIYIVIFILFY